MTGAVEGRAEPTKCQGENDATRDRNILLGKILRFTRDGDIPADNPYTGALTDRCGNPALTSAPSPAITARRPSRSARATPSKWPSTPTPLG